MKNLIYLFAILFIVSCKNETKKEIPIDLIEQVVLEFKDGTKAQLDTRELEHPLPTSPNKTWAQLIKAFQNVNQVTIVVDVNKVEESVGDKVGSMLGKHFE